MVFADEEWKVVYQVAQRKLPPEQPPSLYMMVRMIVTLGGFFNRKRDGFPGQKTLWIGLQRVPDFVLALEAQRSIGESCESWYADKHHVIFTLPRRAT